MGGRFSARFIITGLALKGLNYFLIILTYLQKKKGKKIKPTQNNNPHFQEYEEPVYSYSTYPDRRFS